ncbi:MAG: DNA repair protein RecN [Actinobacteria bacterium]|nr:DNA repair protein RecN [Actinomycetota bacterium]
MLDELHIRDLGVIEDVTLRLASGFNVLTGETGTGKTIVVSALELLCGARASAPQVRQGAPTAIAEARLHPVPAAADEWVDDGDDDLVIARELAVSDTGGRSRARVGGHLAPVSALRAVTDGMIEMHGQQDSTRLTTPSAQRELLDRYGAEGVAGALEAYRATWTAFTAARRELDRLRSAQRERARERDRLRYELDEIDAVDPAPDEEHALEAQLHRMEHAEGLMLAGREAAELLTGDGGARDALGSAVAVLRTMAGVDTKLDALHERLEHVASEAQDVGLELAGYADGVAVDPAGLEQLRARRSAIAQLVRKYGADATEVVTYAAQARTRVEELETDEEQERRLASRLAELADEVERTATALRACRAAAARQLEQAVEEHLSDLAMTGASLEIRLTETPPGPDGADRVDVLLSANAGEPALELGRFASGGERSRIALALRLALADADDTPVLVFDEIDAGIGGAVARQVGAKLAALARGRQVLCVTHSPQLAAHADAHFLVTKESSDGRTRSRVRRLDRDDRVRELSRMLSGSTDSDVASRHADELLTTVHAG